MKMNIASLVIVAFMAAACSSTCVSINETVEIPYLRNSSNFGPVGGFLVKRSALEEVLTKRGLEGKVQLLPLPQFDDDLGEVSVFLQTIEDYSLQSEFPCEIQDNVETSATVLGIGIPVVTSQGIHVLLCVAYFTDAKKPLALPYFISEEAVTYIDSIEMDNGLIILKKNDDSMTIYEGYEELHPPKEDVSKNLESVEGPDVRITNYPAIFGWSCDLFGEASSFCLQLRPFMEGIREADGNVCTTVSSATSTRTYPGCMEITEMTGVFEERAPFLADTLPNVSFEAFWVARKHRGGIVFPCF